MTPDFIRNLRLCIDELLILQHTREKLWPLFRFMCKERNSLNSKREHLRPWLIPQGFLNIFQAERKRNRVDETVADYTTKQDGSNAQGRCRIIVSVETIFIDQTVDEAGE